MYKVLVVDDELNIREGLKLLIPWEELGFQVCGTAKNGRQALEKIKDCKPDLVITDIKMPVIDGLELIKIATEDLELNLKFIILSGFYEFSYAKQAIKYSVKDYILKPIEEEDLIKSLVNIKKDLKKVDEELLKEKERKKVLIEKFIKMSINNVYDEVLTIALKEQLKYIHGSDIRYVAFYFDESMNELQQIEDLKMFKNYILESIGEKYEFNILENYNLIDEGTSIGLIINNSMVDKTCSLKDYIFKVCNYVSNKSNIKFSIYVGQSVNNIREIYKSFESITFIKRIRFLMEKEKFIIYEDVKEINLTSEFIGKELLDDIVEAVENGEVNKIEKSINQLYIEIKNNKEAPHIVRMKFNNYIYRVITSVNKVSGSIETLNSYGKVVYYLNNSVCIENSKEIILEFSKECAEYINQLRQNLSSDILSEVTNYINNNYTENINLKSISNKFYINAAYLGRIFKKRFGICFNDYLNGLRVNDAKELLKNTDKKVYEISELIGYKDTDYFINKFEKIVGQTPHQYRKELIKR